MTNLTDSLLAAWTDKANAARAEGRVALSAPALFKPEWLKRARADFDNAQVAARKVGL